MAILTSLVVCLVTLKRDAVKRISLKENFFTRACSNMQDFLLLTINFFSFSIKSNKLAGNQISHWITIRETHPLHCSLPEFLNIGGGYMYFSAQEISSCLASKLDMLCNSLFLQISCLTFHFMQDRLLSNIGEKQMLR